MFYFPAIVFLKNISRHLPKPPELSCRPRGLLKALRADGPKAPGTGATGGAGPTTVSVGVSWFSMRSGTFGAETNWRSSSISKSTWRFEDLKVPFKELERSLASFEASEDSFWMGLGSSPSSSSLDEERERERHGQNSKNWWLSQLFLFTF